MLSKCTLICLFWCWLPYKSSTNATMTSLALIRSVPRLDHTYVPASKPEGRILKIATPFGRVFFFFLEILTYFTLSMEQLKIELHNLVGDVLCKIAFI